MSEKNENVHAGHRQRMRKRFLEHGFEGFEPHEKLEMLLYYAVPRKDTNQLAHRLIDSYGTFAKVCDAPVDVLQKDYGLSEAAAVLLKMLPQLAAAYMESSLDAQCIDMKNAAEILRPKFIGATAEKVALALSDAKDSMLYCGVISSGSLTATDMPIRKVVDLALRMNARYAYIAHNHPSGMCSPSRADLEATLLLSKTLRSVGIILADHIIFSDTDYLSIRSKANLSKFFAI